MTLRSNALLCLALAGACSACHVSPVNVPPASQSHAADNPQSATAAPTCAGPDDLTRLASPLARTRKRLSTGQPVKIVAIGSSSTSGLGASSPDKSYPSRLAVELKERLATQQITVINRGVGG